MIKTVNQACSFNPVIGDYQATMGIENLTALIADEVDGWEFFSRNHTTLGMKQLFREGMLRLSGKSDLAVFELSQAMGGGKTHLMIALGLLARDPDLRSQVLPPELNQRIDFGNARIAAFNGRNDPANFIWGEIATQLGEEEAIKPHWANGPVAVDQRQWKRIIGNQPTLILLDELPPYLDNASTREFGQGTLATKVVYSLGTLMTAALELPNCCIVIANLSTSSYQTQTKALAEAISNLRQETNRQATTITPVQLAGNEIYAILRKRLIDTLPDERVISDVAEEYAQQVKKAEDGGYLIAASIEQIADQVRDTYPFHPSFKHLVALFKENEGFRQTRGLMQFTARLLNSVTQRDTDDVFLIGAQHLNLNDTQVRDEIGRIAPRLTAAISRDIADNGNSIAEAVDGDLSSDAATQLMTLLLAASLSRTVGGRIGLSEGEMIEFLASPQYKPDEFQEALQRLREKAWYLHREEERFFIKETENLSRQVERNAREIPQARIDQALINRLTGILQPISKQAYQEVQVLPRLDELRLSGPRVLVVIRPDGKVPPSEINDFFASRQEKNNLLVLTGQDSHLADEVEHRLRECYAIEKIHKRLKPADTLFKEAQDRSEEATERFAKALSGAYNRICFPSSSMTSDEHNTLAHVTIDNGLKTGSGDQTAETQIEALLADPRADYKLVLNLQQEFNTYFAMAEACLWPTGKDNRRTPWKDVISRARNNPNWPWMPGNNGMDTLKAAALKQGRWRLGEDGYIEKGPFPKEKTSVNVSALHTDPESGLSTLRLTPRHAGDSPIIRYSTTPEVTDNASQVEDPEHFETPEATLYFGVFDPSDQYQSGPPKRWLAKLKIRHQVEPAADKRRVTLQCAPKAQLRYTLDSTNPKDGREYQQPFEIGREAVRLLVYARSSEATEAADFLIAGSGDSSAAIDDAKPARLQRRAKSIIIDTTERVFGVFNHFREQINTRFKGVIIEIGEGENTVTVRFQEREVTAAMIETTVTSLRQVINEDQAPVTLKISDWIQFDSGFEAKEFARIVGIELRPDEVTTGE